MLWRCLAGQQPSPSCHACGHRAPGRSFLSPLSVPGQPGFSSPPDWLRRMPATPNSATLLLCHPRPCHFAPVPPQTLPPQTLPPCFCATADTSTPLLYHPAAVPPHTLPPWCPQRVTGTSRCQATPVAPRPRDRPGSSGYHSVPGGDRWPRCSGSLPGRAGSARGAAVRSKPAVSSLLSALGPGQPHTRGQGPAAPQPPPAPPAPAAWLRGCTGSRGRAAQARPPPRIPEASQP